MSLLIITLGLNVFISALNAVVAAKNGDACGGWIMAALAWSVAMMQTLEGGAV